MKKTLMAVMAVFCYTLMAATFTSCGDDDDSQSGPYHYSMGFSKISGSNVLEEMGTIEDAFGEALGVEKISDFTANSDNEVVTACRKAATTLKKETFSGSYTLEVKNESTQKKIYSWSNN